MIDNDNSSGFDRLVAGLSSNDRKMMLKNINKNVAPSITLVETEQNPANEGITLKIKYNNESVFYKLYLWFRAIVQKKETEKVYNDDVIARIAKKVNRDYPGIINHRIQYLDTIFYQRLIALREAADFFRPYFGFIAVNPGDFYVFLSSFVAPEIAKDINMTVDPFSLGFDEEPTNDKRNSLLKKLDDILNSISGTSKEKLYDAISAVSWLQKFTRLPFLHFVSQFTNIAGNAYTTPYKNARTDYEIFASLFSAIEPVDNVILEAIFLYSKKKDIEGNTNIQDKDIERAIKEFLVKANSNLALIQHFISGIPIIKVGKIINADYDWTVQPAGSVEAWFPAFRQQWRKIIDVRWNDWIRERKKDKLSNNLLNDFHLEEFPVLKYRPWNSLWMRVPFSCELTGGFLSWFALEVYNDIISVMNDVMMEGVFLRSENRTEYSEALNLFVQANKEMQDLIDRLSPDGDYGAVFEEFSTSKIRTLQIQNQIDSMMASVESTIHDCVSKFQKSCHTIDLIYHGFFSEKKDGMHDSLQNWANIKGHQNRVWKDQLSEIHTIIKKSLFYISELEPIDAATKDE